MKLVEIAHARAGDKGTIINISLIAYEPAHFEHLKRYVTARAVRDHFAGLIKGNIDRYELPTLYAFNYVLNDVVGGGVTRSAALDTHGKTWSSALLELELPQTPTGQTGSCTPG